MTNAARDGDFVVADRNGIVENRHEVHAAVVDASGKLLYTLGNPSRLTLVRSAAKPAQALAVLETGAPERYGFDGADLALMCASHSSEERHISRARGMLAKAQNGEADLRCGGHPALMPEMNSRWIKGGFVPTPVWSNCSGKHAGVLAGAKALGADVADYHQLGHPIQDRIKNVVQDLSGLPAEDIKWGVDGCNMASPALPLHSLGLVNALFAQAADAVERSDAVPPRLQSMARIFNAMVQHPGMVAGDGRFCTALMETYKGQVIGKVGADACYGIGMRESEQTRRLGADGTIGIAVKIEDGNMEILYAAVAEILEQLQLGTPEIRRRLDGFHQKKIINTAGVVTGGLSFPFRIRAV